MKIRRREQPGRGDGDKPHGDRDRGNPGRGRGTPPSRTDKPTRRDEKPSRRSDAPTTRPEKGPPRSPQRPGRTRGPSTGGADGGNGRRPRGRRDGSRRETTPLFEAPLLARTGRELLFGRNAVIEALRGRRSLERLFVAEGVREDDRLRALLALAGKRGVEIERIPRLMLDDAMRGANHQGIALETEPYRYVPFEDLVQTPGTVLVLDHLQDPQNVGTLLRAAETAAVAGVVLPADRAAEVTPAVVNASAGAVEHLRVATVPNLARALEALKGSGRWVAGLATGPGATNIYETEIPTPTVLVVGAEGSGLGANLRKHCDLLLALPMLGRIESLNAATAGAIALYELLRREDRETGASDPDSTVGAGQD